MVVDESAIKNQVATVPCSPLEKTDYAFLLKEIDIIFQLRTEYYLTTGEMLCLSDCRKVQVGVGVDSVVGVGVGDVGVGIDPVVGVDVDIETVVGVGVGDVGIGIDPVVGNAAGVVVENCVATVTGIVSSCAALRGESIWTANCF